MTNASPATKRLIAIAGLVLAVLVVVVLGTGASGGEDKAYRIRAIFDTASFLVPGEDVKIAGVKVGAIESLDITKARKASIVLRIDDPAFKSFKADATCTIRLQSLIGEKYVACKPTQPRSSDAPQPPPLRQIRDGEHKGQYLLPVTNTSSPVDVDLLNDIMREPQRQRFAIILNELGVGLAGNGEELRAVVRRANPALREFDRVLKILADQNRVLADLARDSDAALASVGQQGASISRFIDKAGETAAATAARGDDLERNFEKFPAFLEQLRPTARRLGEFAAAGTPVMTDLRAAAPSINRIFAQLGPFSEAALPTFRTLGTASDAAREALNRSQPVIEDITALGTKLKPLANSLSDGLVDLQKQHGIERLLDVILFTTGTTNGFDDVSHYLRAFLHLPGSCTKYQVVAEDASCKATFTEYASG
ncbi:MAG: MlaD family protein, partial [Conexibacter sp.]